MSSRNHGKDDSYPKPLLGGGGGGVSPPSKSLEEENDTCGGTKTQLLTSVKWHSAPAAKREDGGASCVSPTSKTSSGSTSGWKPLQRQKVVTAASTQEDDEDAETAAERTRKRSAQTVRRGYSCQEPCAGRRPIAAANACGGTVVTVSSTAASTTVENRRRWLSADTGSGPTATGNSRSMECLPSPHPSSTSPSPSPSPSHHRTSFIMAADDRRSLDSGLDDVAAAAMAAEMADRRRGMFASGRTSVPSHLSLALPSYDRRLTIVSPHTHTPSTQCCSTETAWHFSTSSSSSVIATRTRKKLRPGMVLPRLVLPGSSDLDIFSQ